MLAISLLVLCSSVCGLVIPERGNLTALNEIIAPSWVAEPGERGTWRILYSCTFTLVLCVYTSIHLNVPKPNESILSFYARKAGWVIVAIFTPELVVFLAWHQWFQARRLRQMMNKLRSDFRSVGNSLPKAILDQKRLQNPSTSQVCGNDGIQSQVKGEATQLNSKNIQEVAISRSSGFLPDQNQQNQDAIQGESTNSPKQISGEEDTLQGNAPQSSPGSAPVVHSTSNSLRPPPEKDFTQSYGFYCVMGGMSVDVSGFDDYNDRLVLTPSGLLFLAQQGHFLERSELAISDKSKSNLLAKILVCLQVTWMLVNSISRKILGYPLTLLELHTLVHVICALVIYTLWFRKPFDVQDADIISTDEVNEFIALLHMCSPGLGRNQEFCYGPERRFRLEYRFSEASSVSMFRKEIVGVDDDTHDDSRPPRRVINVKDGVSPVLALHPGEATKEGFCAGGFAEDYLIHLSAKDIKRWELASLALAKLGITFDTFKQAHEKQAFRQGPKHAIDLEFLFPYMWSIWGVVVDGLFLKAFPEDPKIFLQPSAADFDWRLDTNIMRLIGGFSIMLIPILLILTGAYGGVHVAAWNFVFPSRAESILWRVASFESMTGGLVIPVFLLVLLMSDQLHEGTSEEYIFGEATLSFFENIRYGSECLLREVGSKWFGLVLKCLISVSLMNAPIFLVSRVYLVIESFISIRHVPEGCYVSVPWAQYIPHL